MNSSSLPSEDSCLLDTSVPRSPPAKNHHSTIPWIWKLGWVVATVALLVAMAPNDSSSKRDERLQADVWQHAWEESLLHVKPHTTTRRYHPSSSESDSEDSRDDLVYLNHTRAFQRLVVESQKTESSSFDFYYYQQGWDAQINQAYCAVASSMAVLNSLRGELTLPQDPLYIPFPWATQSALMENDCVKEKIYNVDSMKGQFWGLGLEMAADLLNCHLDEPFVATAYPVDPSHVTIDHVREDMVRALQDKMARVVINYDRGGIGQGDMGHGHFSPIGAYDAEYDSVLILDVAKYKYPPVWATMERLMGGIGSQDNCGLFNYPSTPPDKSVSMEELATSIGCQSVFRGYIIIEPV